MLRKDHVFILLSVSFINVKGRVKDKRTVGIPKKLFFYLRADFLRVKANQMLSKMYKLLVGL